MLISLVDPYETGLASGKSAPIHFSKETKTFYECDAENNPPFGKQTIAFSEKTFGNRFGEKGEKVPLINRYIFTEDVLQGKDLYVFSQPFFMPFKVDDLIVISSKEYCFIKAPEEIKNEIESLNKGGEGLPNINFSDDEDCKGIKVCFGVYFNSCDINVIGECDGETCKSIYDYGKVIKNNEEREEMKFSGSLVLAAIFSSKDIYDCNVKRLMNKLNELSSVYFDKIKILQRKGCDPKEGDKLAELMGLTKNPSAYQNLQMIYEKANEVYLINKGAGECKLFYGEN
jgi:hypothetical protein